MCRLWRNQQCSGEYVECLSLTTLKMKFSASVVKDITVATRESIYDGWDMSLTCDLNLLHYRCSQRVEHRARPVSSLEKSWKRKWRLLVGKKWPLGQPSVIYGCGVDDWSQVGWKDLEYLDSANGCISPTQRALLLVSELSWWKCQLVFFQEYSAELCCCASRNQLHPGHVGFISPSSQHDTLRIGYLLVFCWGDATNIVLICTKEWDECLGHEFSKCLLR